MRIAKLSLTLIFGVLEAFWHSFIQFCGILLQNLFPTIGVVAKL